MLDDRLVSMWSVPQSSGPNRQSLECTLSLSRETDHAAGV